MGKCFGVAVLPASFFNEFRLGISSNFSGTHKMSSKFIFLMNF